MAASTWAPTAASTSPAAPWRKPRQRLKGNCRTTSTIRKSSVDIFAYNSKKYYIITQGAGFGDNVDEAPITGNETVLDAIAHVGGLSQLSSTKIWIARPAPNGVGCEQILPVNWQDISQGASTATNYQIMPGDRLFIAQDPYRALGQLHRKAHGTV